MRNRVQIVGTHRLAGGQPVAGQAFGYAFDDIGNRTWAARDNDRQDYTANLLNEHTQHTVPGAVWITGAANTGAAIQVNSATADRQGTLFSRKLTVDNTTQAIYSAVAISGIGSNGSTVVTNTATGHAFTPKTPETFTFDDDGNTLSDGRWNYTWDAENRLITAQTATNKAGTAVPAVRLAFTYDSQSRRVRKLVCSWSPAITNWSPVADHWFAYDNWNLISEALPGLALENSLIDVHSGHARQRTLSGDSGQHDTVACGRGKAGCHGADHRD